MSKRSEQNANDDAKRTGKGNGKGDTSAAGIASMISGNDVGAWRRRRRQPALGWDQVPYY